MQPKIVSREEWFQARKAHLQNEKALARTRDIAAGEAPYNYGTASSPVEDLHGNSVFAEDQAGQVYHTYSTCDHGAEGLVGAFGWLDMAPRGGNEADGIMSWVRLHNEYEDAADRHQCCAAAAAE